MRAACSGSPLPQMGIAPANRSGKRASRSQVPWPPIDRPLTSSRRGSRVNSACRLSISSISAVSGLLCGVFASWYRPSDQGASTQRAPVGHCG